MTILSANIALGLPNMDRIMPVVKGHLAFHGQTMLRLFLNPKSLRHSQASPSPRRARYFREHTDLRNTLALIDRIQADVVIINEVLPQFHRDILEPHLEGLGYKTRVWGESKHYPDATVTTVIASRLAGVPAQIDLSWEEHAGGGAGVGALRLTELPITVIGLHLGLADKFPWLYEAEINALAKFISEEQRNGREVVAAGDWNASLPVIQRYASFASLGLVDATNNVATCPTFLPWLRPLDHIFVPVSWQIIGTETRAFGSDHLALIAEVARRKSS